MPDSNKDTKTKATTCLSKIPSLLFVAAVLISAALLLYLCATDNILVEKSRTDNGFSRVLDYSCLEVERDNAPIGIIKEYKFKLDKLLNNDSCLAFYTVHQYVDVYLDGQEIYSLKLPENNRISKTVGSNWVMIPLYPEDSGKEIRIEITPVYESFRNREVEFLIGSRLSIYTDRLSKDLPQLTLSIIAIFVGVVFLFLAGYNQIWRKRGKDLAALGLFAVMMGFWRLTDTRFTPFLVSDKPVFLFYVSITMLMLGMIPLIKSIEENFHQICCRILNIYCMAAAFICLVQLILQILGIIDLRDDLFVTHIVIAVGVGIIIGNVIFERIRYHEKYKNRIGRRLPIICVAGVLADMVAFYVRKTSSGLLFSLLALLFYIVFAGIAMMFRYSEQERQLAEQSRLLAENERQLTENRIATMMSQIQPHFIYNTLGTIEQFCVEDPEKAVNLVQQFSLYLRGNFTELDNAAPIRISQELEHVQYYSHIEQIRFPDMQITYDLKAGEFLLPALTVQPLVENAIKHGLMGLESGGTVEIATYETDEAYYVRVKDDGVGFEPSALSDGKKHIGIKNIRGRIEAMCRGTLTIESTPGVGTTALIMIPKEGEKHDSIGGR